MPVRAHRHPNCGGTVRRFVVWCHSDRDSPRETDESAEATRPLTADGQTTAGRRTLAAPVPWALDGGLDQRQDGLCNPAAAGHSWGTTTTTTTTTDDRRRISCTS